ncbi:helicase [Seminavis robusta]|uniref:Helicase n=1 Tax=Seminavis robusta TaxID=568900 RepID=A0A9N8D5Y1_9STRA|nr:helicase [Seminavis robusta]|eukprot:Sro8_g006850.1 helicase (655) ;mRNA; f:212516-215360
MDKQDKQQGDQQQHTSMPTSTGTGKGKRKRGDEDSSSDENASASESASSTDTDSSNEESGSESDNDNDRKMAPTCSTATLLPVPVPVPVVPKASLRKPPPVASMPNSAKPKTGTTASKDKSKATNKKKRKRSSSGMTAEQRWEWMLERLEEFKEKEGHCNVPNRYPDDPSLGCWVSTQRRHYKKSLTNPGEGLSKERAAKLVAMGFEWTGENPRHKNWDMRYEQLKEFKEQYGHAQVPIGFEDNVQLANWTSTQRQEYKNLLKGKPSRLNERRIQLLNEIGFAWELQRGGRRRRVKVAASITSSTTTGTDDHSTNESSTGTSTTTTTTTTATAREGDSRTSGPGRKRAATKRQSYSTALVLPGVALLGGDQDASTACMGAQAIIPSSVVSPAGTNHNGAHASASNSSRRKKRSRSDATASSTETKQQESPRVATREDAHGPGQQATAESAPQPGNPVAGTDSSASESVVQDPDTLLRARVLGSLLAGDGGGGTAQLGASSQVHSAAPGVAVNLNAYQRALLLANATGGLSSFSMFRQPQNAVGADVGLPTNSSYNPLQLQLNALLAAGNNIGIINNSLTPLQQLGGLQLTLGTANSAYSNAFLAQAAQVLRQPQQVQASLAPAIAAALLIQHQGRVQSQDQEQSVVEAKTDDHE